MWDVDNKICVEHVNLVKVMNKKKLNSEHSETSEINHEPSEPSDCDNNSDCSGNDSSDPGWRQ